MTLSEGEDPFAVAHRLIEELQTTLDNVRPLAPPGLYRDLHGHR